MQIKLVVVAMSTSALLFSCPAAAAGLDFQVFGGSRTTSFVQQASAANSASGSASTDGSSDTSSTFKISDHFAGSEYGVAALGQPLPLLPVAVGGFAMQQSYKAAAATATDAIKGLEAGVEVMAWIPVGMLQPYGRFGYDLYGSHQYTAAYPTIGLSSQDPAQLEIDGKVSGYHGAVGVRLRPTPFFGAFLQLDFAKEVFEAQRLSVTQDGIGISVSAADMAKIDMSSRSVMLGLEVGT